LLVAHLVQLVTPLPPRLWPLLDAGALLLPIVFTLVARQTAGAPGALRQVAEQLTPLLTDAHGAITLGAALGVVGVLVLPGSAAVLVTRGLLDRLSRDETQAVLAHVVASVGNGDLEILAILEGLFRAWGLTVLALAAPLGPVARRALGRVLRVLLPGVRTPERSAREEAVAALLLAGTEPDDDHFDPLLD